MAKAKESINDARDQSGSTGKADSIGKSPAVGPNELSGFWRQVMVGTRGD